ncbi:hypothetical protein FISHEDRAFT_74271 [Fistulina hepatica ATCC 64428]|uniref:Uncharacterized protein n=1 Tax=Fistulina hepatica ATCC 64428 TaxID=1128425 RepID=A0A0D7ABQ6_9AGAR|nr:hypothetical protein FISHEDRAFT_74271 [Fistulina hepatica ATCC 64428]
MCSKITCATEVSVGEQHSNENLTSDPHFHAASHNENHVLRLKTTLEGKRLLQTNHESDSLSLQTPYQGVVFTSNVFTPLPLCEVHIDDHRRPLQHPKGPLHEARSYHDGDCQDGNSEKAAPLLDEADMQMPFRVFSRPPVTPQTPGEGLAREPTKTDVISARLERRLRLRCRRQDHSATRRRRHLRLLLRHLGMSN